MITGVSRRGTGLLRLLSWVAGLLLTGRERRIPPVLLFVIFLLLLPSPVVDSTIRRWQELVGICNAALVVKVSQQFLPRVITAQQVLVACQCTTYCTL